jgi:hypothetical protein
MEVSARRENSDRVLTAVGGNDKLRLIVDQHASDFLQVGDRIEMLSESRVENVNRVVCRVGDEDMAGGRMKRGVIEPSRADVLG